MRKWVDGRLMQRSLVVVTRLIMGGVYIGYEQRAMDSVKGGCMVGQSWI